MAEKVEDISLATTDPVPEEPVISCLEQDTQCDVQSKAPSMAKEHECQSFSDVSQCFQGIANHAQLNRYSHVEECFCIQTRADNAQEIRSIVQSIDTIRDTITDDAKTTKGK